jgi:hypothetical protein
MPSLQLDVAETYDLATKRALARGLGASTQHDGDEMWHPHLDGFNRDWEPSGP